MLDVMPRRERRQQGADHDAVPGQAGRAPQIEDQQCDPPQGHEREKPNVDEPRRCEIEKSFYRNRVQDRRWRRERDESEDGAIAPVLRSERFGQQPEHERQDEHIGDRTEAQVLQEMSLGVIPPAPDADEPRCQQPECEMRASEPDELLARCSKGQQSNRGCKNGGKSRHAARPILQLQEPLHIVRRIVAIRSSNRENGAIILERVDLQIFWEENRAYILTYWA